MTEEEAKEYLNNYKYDNEVRMAIDIVLNELDKKDKQIKELNGRCKNLDKEAQCYLEELVGDSGLKERTIKQLEEVIDKMSIRMALICTGISAVREQFEKQYCEFINSDEDCCWKTDRECTDCIKEYFMKEELKMKKK